MNTEQKIEELEKRIDKLEQKEKKRLTLSIIKAITSILITIIVLAAYFYIYMTYFKNML